MLTVRGAEDAAWTQHYASLGQLIVTNFNTAPFPHASRTNGHTYGGQAYPATTHYQNSQVAIFIPKGFQASDSVDCVIHFHGWRARLERVLERFQLVDQFVASDRNAILVVPQGPLESPDSSGGKLEDPDGFKRFVDELFTVLRQDARFQKAAPGRLILSGHSGGYKVISSILAQGGLTDKIEEVYLFDALYGQTEKYDAWAKRGKRLINIYTTDGGTKAETERWMADLKSRNVPLLAMTKKDITPAALKDNKLIFLFTDLDHNQVLYERHNFRDYLATSCLAARPQ